MSRLFRFGSSFFSTLGVVCLALAVVTHARTAFADNPCDPATDPTCFCDSTMDPPCRSVVSECDPAVDENCQCGSGGCYYTAVICTGCGGTCGNTAPPCVGTCPKKAKCDYECGCDDTGSNTCDCMPN